MGVFKVNGVDIKTIAEVISTSDARAKSRAFSSGTLIHVTGLSDSNKTLANAPGSYTNWGMHNIVGNSLKVNGSSDTVAKLGTRPNFATKSLLASSSSGNLILQYTPSTDTLVLKTNADPSTTIYTGVGKSVVIFQLIGPGGGGGGGNVNFWGGATGGGGGGGGATLIGMIDMNVVPGNKLNITVGSPGSGGSGKNKGGNGSNSTIACSGYTSAVAAAGTGGAAGAGSGGGKVSGGTGGSPTTGNIPGVYIVFQNYGGDGGSSQSTGTTTSSKSTTISVDQITFGATGQSGAGYGSGSNNTPGGGGGASGALMYSSSSPGAGGADRGNGGAGSSYGAGGGGGGANASGSGQSGGSGSAGGFQIFY